jgi:tRNA A-37 threonylcarbamoyl transferase component Bud32
MASTVDVFPDRYAQPTLIASGGMGRIFLATDTELRRQVVVKILAERYAQDESIRARFRREALAAARLSANPNIVTIFDVLEYGGLPMIVMEYLSGGSLEDRVQGHDGCPPGQVFTWMGQAASALDDAHAAGIIHRDIKPANLLLDGRDEIHVGDFGIASAVGLDSNTETGTILGTAGYLSPEQALGERATAASDRYSLAVVAFELLAGERPFAADSTVAEATRHATAPIPSLHTLKAELPASLDRVFRKALAKKPADRYPTAAEFVAELRAAVHADAGTTGWLLPAAAAQMATTAVSSSGAPARDRRATLPGPRSGGSRRWLLPVALLLLLAGGLAAAFATTRGSAQQADSTPKPVTVVHTVTSPGQTVERTVTAAAPPPPATTPATSAPLAGTGASGSELNSEGYTKMKAGDYRGALPLLEQAVQKLSGTNSLAEAYADYNLADTRYELGRCSDVMSLLDRSQAIQGRRSEIEALRRDAQRTCGG